MLTTRAHADENGWPVLAVVGASGQVAGPDNSLHSQPARAIEKALAKQGIAAADLDLVEINEAFGAVVARSQAELGLSDDVVNPHGGGIAHRPSDRRLGQPSRRPRRARAGRAAAAARPPSRCAAAAVRATRSS